MPAIPFIKKKIGQSYLVWFQNSNKYLQLEEPAWFVLRETKKGYKAATLAKAFATRYSASPQESSFFVRDIRSRIEKLNQPDPLQGKLVNSSALLNVHVFTPYSVHRYKLGHTLLSFAYESRLFEYYLHPLICHFETEEQSPEMPLFELFAHEDQIVFRYKGQVKGVWAQNETHLVKGLIFMHLINLMYDKTDADWLMTVHASAITNGKKTILFSAPPNHGKTTIAALLQSRGYQLISDDFVPIDRLSFQAYPFPIAMSVKQSSMDVLSPLFPALEEKRLNYISPEKSVRYLAAGSPSDLTQMVFPVHEFIFIKYNRSFDFVWEKLDQLKAIKLLLDQTWVIPSPENTKRLFGQLNQITCYQLTYSNNEKALEAISRLFDHD